MKKLLIATLTTLSIITPSVHAGERIAKDDRVEIHKECFMHPVLVGKDKKLNIYTGQEYEINANYDGVTGYRINTDYETIMISTYKKLRDRYGKLYDDFLKYKTLSRK